jgi:hypothetical protein
MHSATPAARTARYSAHEFRHHVPRGDAFRERMTVTAMRAGDVVVLSELRTNASRDRFFAHIYMDKSGHFSQAKNLSCLQLELAN